MATLTISDEIFERLTRQAQTVNTSPEMVAESVLQSYLETQTDLTPIRTLGDLLAYGYGLWANRVVREDTVAYAARLRSEAWQRQP